MLAHNIILKIMVASLEGSWIYTRVNVKVRFVFIWTSGYINILWVIITFIVYTVLELLLGYIYS